MAAVRAENDSDSDSDSGGEDFSDAPDMRDFITAKNALAEMNTLRKEHLDTIKRKRDEVEDYLISKNVKFMRIEGMVVQFKNTKKLSWNEKALREHVDEDGKLDIDMYKNNQTEIVQKMSIKID
jgi:hypothetical protein